MVPRFVKYYAKKTCFAFIALAIIAILPSCDRKPNFRSRAQESKILFSEIADTIPLETAVKSDCGIENLTIEADKILFSPGSKFALEDLILRQLLVQCRIRKPTNKLVENVKISIKKIEPSLGSDIGFYDSNSFMNPFIPSFNIALEYENITLERTIHNRIFYENDIEHGLSNIDDMQVNNGQQVLTQIVVDFANRLPSLKDRSVFGSSAKSYCDMGFENNIRGLFPNLPNYSNVLSPLISFDSMHSNNFGDFAHEVNFGKTQVAYIPDYYAYPTNQIVVDEAISNARFLWVPMVIKNSKTVLFEWVRQDDFISLAEFSDTNNGAGCEQNFKEALNNLTNKKTILDKRFECPPSNETLRIDLGHTPNGSFELRTALFLTGEKVHSISVASKARIFSYPVPVSDDCYSGIAIASYDWRRRH